MKKFYFCKLCLIVFVALQAGCSSTMTPAVIRLQQGDSEYLNIGYTSNSVEDTTSCIASHYRDRQFVCPLLGVPFTVGIVNVQKTDGEIFIGYGSQVAVRITSAGGKTVVTVASGDGLSFPNVHYNIANKEILMKCTDEQIFTNLKWTNPKQLCPDTLPAPDE